MLSWRGHSDMVVVHWRSHDCSGLAWLDYSSVWWTTRDSPVSGELGGQDDSSIHHTMQGRRGRGHTGRASGSFGHTGQRYAGPINSDLTGHSVGVSWQSWRSCSWTSLARYGFSGIELSRQGQGRSIHHGLAKDLKRAWHGRSDSGRTRLECSSVRYTRQGRGLIVSGLVDIVGSIYQTRRGRSSSGHPGHDGCGSVEQTRQRRAGFISGGVARRDGAIG